MVCSGRDAFGQFHEGGFQVQLLFPEQGQSIAGSDEQRRQFAVVGR